MTTAPVAQPRIRSRRRPARGLRKLLLGVAGLLGFLGTWQLLPLLGVVDAQFLPPATTVLAQLATEFQDLEFWRNVGRTMTTWFLGLLIATVAAVVIGTIIGLVPYLRRLTHTTVEFLRPIPSVALIPLAILMFGFQMPAALLIVVYASFWQVFVQVLYGVADVDTVARDTAKSFGLTRASRFRNLVLPTALPYIMTGVRLGAAVALILTVTAELLIAVPGIGRVIVFARGAGDVPTVYVYIVVAGLLGLIVNLIFRLIERRVLSWHQSVRGETIV
jgi:ABC-type nitrate/sulfonate/bicarbonate transport system permease component